MGDGGGEETKECKGVTARHTYENADEGEARGERRRVGVECAAEESFT